MEKQRGKVREVRLTSEEVKLLDRLAASFGIPPDEYLRQVVLDGLRLAQSAQEGAIEAGLSPEETAERVVRSSFWNMPQQPNPEVLRLVAHALEKRAKEVESQRPEIKERQHLARAMRDLRERIRQRVGDVPDIEGLIDEGRDDV